MQLLTLHILSEDAYLSGRKYNENVKEKAIHFDEADASAFLYTFSIALFAFILDLVPFISHSSVKGAIAGAAGLILDVQTLNLIVVASLFFIGFAWTLRAFCKVKSLRPGQVTAFYMQNLTLLLIGAFAVGVALVFSIALSIRLGVAVSGTQYPQRTLGTMIYFTMVFFAAIIVLKWFKFKSNEFFGIENDKV